MEDMIIYNKYNNCCICVALGNSPIAAKLRLYAQVCRKLLGMFHIIVYVFCICCDVLI